MVKIQINSIAYGLKVDVDDQLFDFLKTNVKRSYIRDGISNFSLSRLNFALRKISKKFNMETGVFENHYFPGKPLYFR